MGDNCKYIVVKKGDKLIPIVFPSSENHQEIAELIGGTVLSAGFANFRGTVKAVGKSVSLEMGPDEGDNSLLRIFLDVSP